MKTNYKQSQAAPHAKPIAVSALRQQIQHPCPNGSGALSLDERAIVLGLS